MHLADQQVLEVLASVRVVGKQYDAAARREHEQHADQRLLLRRGTALVQVSSAAPSSTALTAASCAASCAWAGQALNRPPTHDFDPGLSTA